MNITFIGHSSCIPDIGGETACFIINGKHLVDTGWCAALKMRGHGFDPLALESIILTHLHQDHYLGLPQLLFYIGLRGRGRESASPLKIIGPAEHLARVVKAAEEFQQIDRFPELKVNYRLVPLAAGESFEMSDLRLETCAANHVSGHKRPEPALVYKAVHLSEGAWFAFTGDTHYHPPIADFVRNAPLLIHDGAHTSAKDAATIAKMADVGRLILIHYAESRADQLLKEAKEVFPDTALAREGATVQVHEDA